MTSSASKVKPPDACPKCGSIKFAGPTYSDGSIYSAAYGAGKCLIFVCVGCGYKALTQCLDDPRREVRSE